MHIEVITRRPETANVHPVPILCVHGGYHGAWCWDEHFLPYFANAGFEAHALSLRGHGQSDGHDNINRWRIADYVTDVATVVEQLPAMPVLIGHSLGGVVVQHYLAQRIAPAAILLASSPHQGMMKTSLKMLLRYPRPMIKMLATGNMAHALPLFETIFFSEEMPRERVHAYFRRMGNESFCAFMDVVLFDKPQLRKTQTPMFIIGGEKDSSIPTTTNQALARAYGAHLEVFPAAHDMMLESEWELVARRIVEWLTDRLLIRHSGSPAISG